MIGVNLLKPKIRVYADSEPGGIIDIEKIKANHKIKPCLYEVLWDKKSFNECLEETKRDKKD